MDFRTYVLRGMISAISSNMKSVNEYDLTVFADFSALLCGYRGESAEVLKNVSNTFVMRDFKNELIAQSLNDEAISKDIVKLYKEKEQEFLKNNLIRRFFQSPDGQQYLDRLNRTPVNLTRAAQVSNSAI